MWPGRDEALRCCMPTVEQLERLLQADPNDAFVLYGLAQAHAKENRHEQAIEFYDRAIEADRTNGYHFFHKAKSQLALEQTEDAKATLEAGIIEARAVNDGKALGELSEFLASI
ncbi:MAG: tetratricopeptide repeat protein [Planctomycetota bacterium]